MKAQHPKQSTIYIWQFRPRPIRAGTFQDTSRT